ncbi:zinc transporter 6-like isoform X1 [Argiope bruennichi]|uniref:zinc transporter 6-like isoform X1 n=2 Tax=Argiope bruennichi TaxID=94029 RepID=UPI002494F381|nr:zinc transporter 6-like isoform X1 [Argiope bruennichi]
MEDLRLRSNPVKSFSVGGKILGKHSFPVLTSFLRELKPVYKDNRFQRIVWLGLVNFLSLLLLLSWCNVTESMGLLSYTYLIFFDTLCLCICALSIWVEQKKPNAHYTFGYERLEVLAVFVSTTFTLVNSIFIIRRSIWRWIQQAQIHTGLLIPGIVLAFLCHMLITYCMKNKGLNLVICASDSSWLQNRMSFFNQSLSHVVPGVTTNSWPRFNPFSLLGCTAGGILVLTTFLVDIFNYHSADALAGIFISFLICLTMYPLSAYSGKILLQGTPPHVKDLLDKCLREVSTLDGVLEFRNEHFWLLGFDKIVGTIHVRIRRDANEQIVLSHLLNKLSSMVTDITIQIFKDEWTWSSGTRQILGDHFLKFPTGSESYSLPTTVTTSVSSTEKEVILNPNLSYKNSYASAYTAPSTKTHDSKKTPGSYATIPLPPSLSSSHSPKSPVQEYSIDMTSEANLAQTHASYDTSPHSVRQVPYSLQSVSSTNKYNRELTINPLFTSKSDYVKYKS